ncbi:MAG: hypothetical protein Q4B31_00050 [Clostridia bacterium]|nr:hypothetical protein [Clostridia bacterium]
MKKIGLILMVVVMMFSITACGEKSKNAGSVETVPSLENLDRTFSEGAYDIGKDIKAGKYLVNCSDTDYGMDIIVFADKQAYDAFQNADKTTNGEFRRAVEMNSWANFYIKKDEAVYMSLEEGDVLFLDNGECKLEKFNPDESSQLNRGIYVIGKDLDSEGIEVKSVSYRIKTLLFENAEKYLAYNKTDRATVGDEGDAIKKYAVDEEYVYEKDTVSFDLKEGMILIVNEGIGEVLN